VVRTFDRLCWFFETRTKCGLVSLAECGERRREMGVAGRARAIDHFTWERAARQVQKIDSDVRARLTSRGAGKA